MAMNMKTSKKMKGFMCHSPSSTSVCMSQNRRSVIVPRRPERSTVDQVRFVNNTKYVRLGDQMNRSYPVSSLKKIQENVTQQVTTTTSLAIADNVFQVVHLVHYNKLVVVMRVSIHCQGCAGKVKKHLSRMEGVTSFSIDLESKRVTVMGHVSPSGVLESISKVKKAEFWPC